MNGELKNKNLDISDKGPVDSGRSSPFLRELHNQKHHSHDGHAHRQESQLHGKSHRLQQAGRKIQHGLQKSSARQTGQPNDCFIGLAFRVLSTRAEIDRYKKETGYVSRSQVDLEKGEKLLTWTIVVSDGVGTIDKGQEATTLKVTTSEQDEKQDWKMVKHVSERIITDALEVANGKSLIFQILAISEPLPEILANCPIFLPSFWTHLNVIPIMVPSPTTIFKNLPDPDPEFFATDAVNTGIRLLHPAIHSAVAVTCRQSDRLVEVDAAGKIKIASAVGYQQSTSDKLWKRFMALVRHVKVNDIKWVRASATAQGGGVALMQHALVRLWHLVGLGDNGTWIVPLAHPSIFDITKKKFHNVLQGVADPEASLEENEERYFEAWIKSNYETFWKDSGVLKGRILVADDPQVVPLIPRVKHDFPENKIIFRSHIQIQSDLTDDPKTEQAHVWDYLFDKIKHADMFLAHPVEFFVPQNVKDTLPVLYMPPSTDPLDGLNKPIGHEALHDLRQVYKHLSLQQCAVEMDWKRGYVLQVARFDPSKGLPDLLAGYLGFRQKLVEAGKGEKNGNGNGRKPPQLVVVGHGSVDDPDGTRIYEELHQIVNSKEYKLVTNDVSIVRAPPSDTLLGALMQGAWCATQLSTREGFEVKVSEAVLKRVPIIASKAGGIPLQVKDGVNGWLVDPGAPDQVAQILFEFYTGKRLLNRRQGRPDEEYSEDRLHSHHKYDDATVHEMPRVDGKSNPDHTHDQTGDPGLVGEANGDSKIKEGKRLTPNDTADQFVKTIGAPFPTVKPTPDGPSEDFFTIGNATKWLLLFSLISGKSIKAAAHSKENGGAGEEEVALLKSMGLREEDWVGGKEEMKKWSDKAVWKMVMGDDMDQDEGRVIWKDEM